MKQVHYKHWNLEDLLSYVESCPRTKKLGVSAELFSYRGYYDHVGMPFGECTAGELVQEINSFLKKGYMEGYKGGTFPIHGYCLVFVTADESTTGPMLLGFTPEGAVIVCEESWK